MLRKKEVYTTITPIPGFIPRQLALDILHSHSEVITLNPLVIDHKPIPAPPHAPVDEYYSTWYEITERMQWIPRLGRMGSGKIKFTGCFHDMPWGLQTHTYAPMGVDIRIKYRVDGNQPGLEPPQPHELGLADLGAPSDGLYLREDIEIRCNVTMVGYVKSELQSASKGMVARIIKKAELLDAGLLSAMFEDGKLRTINPNDRSQSLRLKSPSFTGPHGGAHAHHYQPYHLQQQQKQQQQHPHCPPAHVAELAPASGIIRAPAEQTSFMAELPGNYYHPQASPGLPTQQQFQQQGGSPLPSHGVHNPSRDSHDSRASESSSNAWRSPQQSPRFAPSGPQPSPSFPPSRPISTASSGPSRSWPVDREPVEKG
ncbi:hypothetical protein ACRALDRAFT_1072815 [Sodiomyces alcalophilus JCM 7366]|uniref:uncharacterized protein n=1 Tax=Sodiomyces alcalophilus JCM 7366 TaxID=591952 RepID=UPI0039B50C4B